LQRGQTPQRLEAECLTLGVETGVSARPCTRECRGSIGIRFPHTVDGDHNGKADHRAPDRYPAVTRSCRHSSARSFANRTQQGWFVPDGIDCRKVDRARGTPLRPTIKGWIAVAPEDTNGRGSVGEGSRRHRWTPSWRAGAQPFVSLMRPGAGRRAGSRWCRCEGTERFAAIPPPRAVRRLF
jgi:hypothetical protein